MIEMIYVKIRYGHDRKSCSIRLLLYFQFLHMFLCLFFPTTHAAYLYSTVHAPILFTTVPFQTIWPRLPHHAARLYGLILSILGVSSQ